MTDSINEPMVSESDRGFVLVLDTEFTASLVDGIWYSGMLFTPIEQMEDFTLIADADKVARVVATARDALGVRNPPFPGDAYAALLSPLAQLEETMPATCADPVLEEFRLSSRQERARLQLRRYSLSFRWVGLLWQVLLEDRLRNLAEAREAALLAVRTLDDLVPLPAAEPETPSSK